MNTSQLSPIPLNNHSLADLKRFNQTVYGAVNGRNFEIYEMLGRLAEYNSRVSLRVRKADTARTPYHLCMMLSWLLAIANRLEVPLHEEVARWCETGLSPNIPLPELQKHFTSRHSGAILPNTALCLAEKVQALQAAVGKYRATHEKSHFEDAGKKWRNALKHSVLLQVYLGWGYMKRLCYILETGVRHVTPSPAGVVSEQIRSCRTVLYIFFFFSSAEPHARLFYTLCVVGRRRTVWRTTPSFCFLHFETK